MSYESVREKLIAHKPQAALVLGFVFVFFVGLGTGKFVAPERKPVEVKDYSKYNTKIEQKTTQEQPVENAPEAGGGEVQGAGTQVKIGTEPAAVNAQKEQAKKSGQLNGICAVKGNISSKGDKIYHMPGGAFYDRVRPEQCFTNEAEAKSAGFRKSSR